MSDSSSAVTLTVSWKAKNFRMLSKTARPHTIAATMEAKLSSISQRSAAALQTAVPERNIAIPTSADFSAGASFVPSPVAATTSPSLCRNFTSSCLSCGLERASTRRRRTAERFVGRSESAI